jgi:hypothetical protein
MVRKAIRRALLRVIILQLSAQHRSALVGWPSSSSSSSPTDAATVDSEAGIADSTAPAADADEESRGVAGQTAAAGSKAEYRKTISLAAMTPLIFDRTPTPTLIAHVRTAPNWFEEYAHCEYYLTGTKTSVAAPPFAKVRHHVSDPCLITSLSWLIAGIFRVHFDLHD